MNFPLFPAGYMLEKEQGREVLTHRAASNRSNPKQEGNAVADVTNIAIPLINSIPNLCQIGGAV